MKQPLVSIIIPTYNRAHFIGETLDSVLAQTYTNWECIIVDDGSTDNTAELLKIYCDKDTRFKYVQRPDTHKPGGNGARNYGFELSKGEYINWLDSDDLIDSKKIELQVSRLVLNKMNFSVCQTMDFKENIFNILGIRIEKIYSVNPFESYLKGDLVWLLTPLWKRNFLEQMDYLFDETLRASQEWEFICRILFHYNEEYDFIEKPLVFARKHEESISNNDNKQKRIEYYIEARKKLYFYLSKYSLEKNIYTYFGNYFVSKYKYYLRNRNYRAAYNLLVDPLIRFNYFEKVFKYKLVILMLSFIFFNRGEMILKGNKYKSSK